ncbi:MAG: hypothetical protein ACRC35_01180 [Angustibacter sp.]
MREWRSWLEELAAVFASCLPIPADADADTVLATWERAVAQLVTLVAERTQAEESWHYHCREVLGWFLDAAEIPPSEHGWLMQDAIAGRFASWCAPTDKEVAMIARRVARTMWLALAMHEEPRG